jgi:hypothetical protein
VNRVIAIGFPEGESAALGQVTQCGDGVHVFTPIHWRRRTDFHCVCGDVVPGLPVLLQSMDATVMIPDAVVERSPHR